MISVFCPELIDCTESPNQKCNGGYLPPAFDIMIKPGLELAKDYPYLAKNGTCKRNIKPAVKLKDYTDVSDKMDAALPTSPLAVCMTVVWEVMVRTISVLIFLLIVLSFLEFNLSSPFRMNVTRRANAGSDTKKIGGFRGFEK